MNGAINHSLGWCMGIGFGSTESTLHPQQPSHLMNDKVFVEIASRVPEILTIWKYDFPAESARNLFQLSNCAPLCVALEAESIFAINMRNRMEMNGDH
jgi:hypothetical protein